MMAGLLDTELNLAQLDKSIQQAMAMLGKFEQNAKTAIGVTLKKVAADGARAMDGMGASARKAAKDQDLIGKVLSSTTPKIDQLLRQQAMLRRNTSDLEKQSNRYKRAMLQLTNAIEKSRIKNDGALRTQRKANSLYKASLTPLKRLQHGLGEINKALSAATTKEQKRMLGLARANQIKKIAAKREAELARGGRGLFAVLNQQTNLLVGRMVPGLSSLTSQLKLGAVALGVFGAAAVAGLGLKKSAVAAAEFNFALATLQNKMGLAGDSSAIAAAQLRAVEKAAIDAGLATKFSATEAVGGLQNLITAGFSTREAIEAIGPALAFATAQNIEISEAAQIAAASTNIFAHESLTLSERLGILARATEVSNIQTGDLSQLLSKMSRSASLAKQDMSEVVTVLRAGRNAMIPMEEVGTGVANALLFIAKKAKDGKLQLGDQSVQVADSVGNFRKLGDILLDVGKATQHLGSVAQANLLTKVFGTRSIAPVIQQIIALQDGMKGANGEIIAGADALDYMRQQMQNTGDIVAKEQATLTNTTKGTIEIIIGQWDTLFTVMGQRSDGFFNSLAKAISAALGELVAFTRFQAEAPDRTAIAMRLQLQSPTKRITADSLEVSREIERMARVAKMKEEAAAREEELAGAISRSIEIARKYVAEQSNVPPVIEKTGEAAAKAKTRGVDPLAAAIRESIKAGELFVRKMGSPEDLFGFSAASVQQVDRFMRTFVGGVAEAQVGVKDLGKEITNLYNPSARLRLRQLITDTERLQEVIRGLGAGSLRSFLSDIAATIKSGFAGPIAAIQTSIKILSAVLRGTRTLFELFTDQSVADIEQAFKEGRENPIAFIDQEEAARNIEAKVKTQLLITKLVLQALPGILVEVLTDAVRASLDNLKGDLADWLSGGFSSALGGESDDSTISGRISAGLAALRNRASTDEFYPNAKTAGPATDGDSAAFFQRGGANDPFRAIAEQNDLMRDMAAAQRQQAAMADRQARALNRVADALLGGGVMRRLAAG